uniref:UPF0481 protein At3g47200 family n=3 Tax=Cajanus cajan TaxID=3821 RepID=A0A151TSY7_CAJCA|nr:UPF0481 protein At3g47200 family [Cajanus cajan]
MHFTDLIRTFHLQHHSKKLPDKNPGEVVTHLPSTTELSEAGVRFNVNINKFFPDFEFSRGVLTIPQLIVQDSTEILFRNMVVLEQCHYPLQSYIANYVIVMDFLVNKSSDVDILVQERVLHNLLGDSDSVAKLFNGLGKNIVLSNMSSHYGHLAQKLNAFQGNPWNKLKSTLRRDYCKTPWQSAVSIAGILLLVLSLLQTVCSVVQVIQQ